MDLKLSWKPLAAPFLRPGGYIAWALAVQQDNGKAGPGRAVMLAAI